VKPMLGGPISMAVSHRMIAAPWRMCGPCRPAPAVLRMTRRRWIDGVRDPVSALRNQHPP